MLVFYQVPVLTNGSVFFADSHFSCPRFLAFKHMLISPLGEDDSLINLRKVIEDLNRPDIVVSSPALAFRIVCDKKPPISCIAGAALRGSSSLSFKLVDNLLYGGRSMAPGVYTFRIAVSSDGSVLVNGMRSGLTFCQAEAGAALWESLLGKDEIPPVPAFLKDDVCRKCAYLPTCERIKNGQADKLSNVKDML